MSPEDYRDGADGRPRWALTAGRNRERVRRFTEEDAARILRAHTHLGPGRNHRSLAPAAG
jgi:hypothetical protein